MKYKADKKMAVIGLRVTPILAMLILLPGCGVLGQGDFSCPGGIEGVRCMSARKVYEATESSDYVKTESEVKDEKNNSQVQTKSALSSVKPVAVPRIDQPIPIRTEASVMRIWTAPWEDDAGDLHADGFLYTEIEGRKWNLGNRFKSPSSTLSPLSAGPNPGK